jgi:hypothetical protein
VMMLENPYKHGPFGAKGVGEMPIDGPAPAVINALRHAGYDLREIPATPEKLMAAHVLPHRPQSTQRKGSGGSSAIAAISAVKS